MWRSRLEAGDRGRDWWWWSRLKTGGGGVDWMVVKEQFVEVTLRMKKIVEWKHQKMMMKV